MFVGTVGGGIGRGVGFVQKMRERVNREGFDLYLFHYFLLFYCFLLSFIIFYQTVEYNRIYHQSCVLATSKGFNWQLKSSN